MVSPLYKERNSVRSLRSSQFFHAFRGLGRRRRGEGPSVKRIDLQNCHYNLQTAIDYHLKRVLPRGLVGQAKNLDVAESWLTPDPAESLAVPGWLAMMSVAEHLQIETSKEIRKSLLNIFSSLR